MREKKEIKISIELWKKLNILKTLNGFRSIEQVIEARLNGFESEKIVDELLGRQGTESENKDREKQNNNRFPTARLEIE